MKYIENYVKQMRENCVKDNNGNIVCTPELWEEIASVLENYSHIQMPLKQRTAEEVINNFKGMSQITEIANTIANECCLNCMWCDYAACTHAEAIYAAGYRKKQEWISVEDGNFPKLLQMHLVIVDKHNGHRFVSRAAYTSLDNKNEWALMGPEAYAFFCNGWEVTHWMPLPELPKEAE